MARAPPPPPPGLRMRDTVLSIVKPIRKTQHLETIDATFVDLMRMDSFIPVIFAYRPADKSEAAYSRLVNRIKESLQKVLVPFFGFAGRWVPSSGGSRRLLCNDEGVPFIEAFVDEELDSVVKASAAFQPVTELNGLGVLGMDMTSYDQRMPPEGGQPCVVAQVTRFKCGGVVLGVAFNHTHTDGQGFYTFMRAWSDFSRTNGTAIKVDHNRALPELASLSQFFIKQHDRIGGKTSTDRVNDHCSKVPERLALKAFEVRASKIKAAKLAAEDGGVGYVSTVDCIVAHLWKTLARLPPVVLDGREITVFSPVEGRNRFLDPPRPNMCGNCFAAMVTPKIPTQELLEMPLAAIAGKQREKLSTTRREEWFGQQSFRELASAMNTSKSALLIVTSWFNFPMYEIDFGAGKPFFASTTNMISPINGVCCGVIAPPTPGSCSSIATLYILCLPAVLEALENVPDFLSFFVPHPNHKDNSQ